MKTVKPNANNLGLLQTAAVNLKRANQQLAAAKKDVDNAKSILQRWLISDREIDINAQEIGEVIQIEEVCLIERGKQNKFDEAAFATAHPDLYASFRRDFGINKFKPLI